MSLIKSVRQGNLVFMSDTDKIMAAWPFFGGADENPPVDEGKTAPPAKTVAKETVTETPGGNPADEDPIAKLQSDPIALRDLLNQVSKQQGDLQKISGEHATLTAEKEKQARLQLSKEENLQKDLDNANAQIEQMTEIVRNVALQNAFIEKSGEVQWNSVKQAMAELLEDNYQVDVDVNNRTAEVTGIEKEIQRIAKDSPWLVKSGGVVDPNGSRGPGRPRSNPTGAPPAGPKANGDKSARRAQMMNRYPVLSQRLS